MGVKQGVKHLACRHLVVHRLDLEVDGLFEDNPLLRPAAMSSHVSPTRTTRTERIQHQFVTSSEPLWDTLAPFLHHFVTN